LIGEIVRQSVSPKEAGAIAIAIDIAIFRLSSPIPSGAAPAASICLKEWCLTAPIERQLYRHLMSQKCG